MESFLLILLVSLCCMVVYWACVNFSQVYQAPFFINLGFLAVPIPQLFGLYADPSPLTLASVDKATLMSIFCVITCWISYRAIQINHRYLSKINLSCSLNKFFHWGIFYTLVGNFFWVLVGDLPEDKISTQATGILVQYLFFAQLIYLGFALLVVPTINNPSFLRMSVLVMAMVQPLTRFLIFGRRTETLVFFCIILLSLFFIKKIIIPKKFLLPGIVGGILFGVSIGQYRSLVTSSQSSIFTSDGIEKITTSVSDIDWVNGFLTQPSFEMKFAASVMEAIQSLGGYGFGTVYWNKLVFSYIPAQWFGESFKRSFYLPAPDVIGLVQSYFGFQTFQTGLTITCVGELFVEFWFFGCLVFVIVSFVYKHLWVLANEYKNSLAQVFYSLSLPFAVVAVGAGTSHLLAQMVYYAMFLYPVFLYSKTPHPTKDLAKVKIRP